MANVLLEMVHNREFEHADASFMWMSFIMCAQVGEEMLSAVAFDYKNPRSQIM